MGRVSKRLGIQISRPIIAADGRFAGVVVFFMAPEQFTNFVQQVNLGLEGVFSIVSESGVLLSRSKDPDQSVGRQVPPQLFASFLRERQGLITRPSILDGVRRTVSYRWLDAFPLLVMVAASPQAMEAEVASQQGKTVFLSSHMLNEVEQTCDRVAIIHQGQLIREGAVTELLAEESKLRIQASPLDKALEALQGHWGVSASDGWLVVNATAEDSPGIVRRLVEQNICVYQAIVERQSLEDYFMTVTRLGKTNAAMSGLLLSQARPRVSGISISTCPWSLRMLMRRKLPSWISSRMVLSRFSPATLSSS